MLAEKAPVRYYFDIALCGGLRNALAFSLWRIGSSLRVEALDAMDFLALTVMVQRPPRVCGFAPIEACHNQGKWQVQGHVIVK